jgi:hypothetical protein
MEMKVADPYLDINQNPVLGGLCYTTSIYVQLINFIFVAQGFTDIVGSRYGWLVHADVTTASTDFVRSPPCVFICSP